MITLKIPYDASETGVNSNVNLKQALKDKTKELMGSKMTDPQVEFCKYTEYELF